MIMKSVKWEINEEKRIKEREWIKKNKIIEKIKIKI